MKELLWKARKSSSGGPRKVATPFPLPTRNVIFIEFFQQGKHFQGGHKLYAHLPRECFVPFRNSTTRGSKHESQSMHLYWIFCNFSTQACQIGSEPGSAISCARVASEDQPVTTRTHPQARSTAKNWWDETTPFPGTRHCRGPPIPEFRLMPSHDSWSSWAAAFGGRDCGAASAFRKNIFWLSKKQQAAIPEPRV